MGVNRKRIKYFEFRHLTGKTLGLKKGLYFFYIMGRIEKTDRVNESDILALTEWLNRYCAQYIHKKNVTSFAETRAKARATVRAIEILESNVNTQP